MKRMKIIFFVTAMIGSFVFAFDHLKPIVSMLDDHIIEQSDKATPGKDWRFELKNNSGKDVYLNVSLSRQQIVPTQEQQAQATTEIEEGYVKVLNGKSIRIGALEPYNLYYSIVTQNDLKMITDRVPQAVFSRYLQSSIHPNNRINSFDLNALTSTIFLEIDKEGKVKPIVKSAMQQTTDSGLSLNNNISYSDFIKHRAPQMLSE